MSGAYIMRESIRLTERNSTGSDRKCILRSFWLVSDVIIFGHQFEWTQFRLVSLKMLCVFLHLTQSGRNLPLISKFEMDILADHPAGHTLRISTAQLHQHLN